MRREVAISQCFSQEPVVFAFLFAFEMDLQTAPDPKPDLCQVH